jgi:uncharacterized surface anchored protein
MHRTSNHPDRQPIVSSVRNRNWRLTDVSAALRIFVVLVFVLGISSAFTAGAAAQKPGLPEIAATSIVPGVINTVSNDTNDPTAVETAVPDSPPETATDTDPTGAAGDAPTDVSQTDQSTDASDAVDDATTDSAPPPDAGNGDAGNADSGDVAPANVAPAAATDSGGDVSVASLGAVTIVKINCEAAIDLSAVNVAAVIAGTADLASLGCELASGVDFTATDPITGATLGSGTTTNGIATIDNLTIGSQVTLTEDVPVGFAPQGSSSRTITVAPVNAQLFVNVAVSGTPLTALVVIKLNCDAAVDLSTIDLDAIVAGTADLASLGCQLASNVAITVTDPVSGSTLAAGNTLNGIVTFTGLPVGSAVNVDEGGEAGFTAQNPGPHSITLADGGNVDLFVNVNDNAGVTTPITITKLNCAASITVDPTDVLTGALTEADLIDLGCTPADGVPFTITDPISGTQLGAGVTVDGELTVADLSVGAAIRITETSPAGFDPITPVQDLIVAVGLNPLFVNLEQPPDTTPGSVTVHTVDPAGDPLPGACYEIHDSGDAVVGSACDADDGTNDGTTIIDNLPLGSDTVVQTTPPAGYNAADPVPVTLTAEDPDAVVTVTNDNGGPGSVTIHTVNPGGDALTGACYDVHDAADNVVGSACDATDGADDGTTVVDNLAPGDYAAVQTTPPAGYNAAENTPFAITVADPNAEITVTNDNGGPGSVTVDTVNSDGDALLGACYDIQDASAASVGSACDADDGANDGTTTVDNLAPGSYNAVQTTPPAGYNAADDTPFAVTVANPDAHITVTNDNGGSGSVTIDTVDPNGDPLTGACYEVRTAGDNVVGSACDADDGANDGTTVIDNLPPDSYVATQTTPPAGYEAAGDTPFAVTTAQPDAYITVTNGEAVGSVTVHTVDPFGNPLAGACYDVRTAGNSVAGSACDADDGTNDGTTAIDNLPLGSDTVVQTTPPAGYNAADPTPVTLTSQDPDADITVTNDNGGPGSVTIHTVAPSSDPLTGACYAIHDSGDAVVGSACDADDGANDGTTVVDNLPLGAETVVQTTPPTGYGTADSVPVTLTEENPDATVTVTNETATNPSTVHVVIVDENGDPLPGVCIRVDGTNSTPSTAPAGSQICDDDDGTADGLIDVIGLPVEDYTLTTTVVPDGYTVPPTSSFSITTPGQTLTVTVTVSSTDNGNGNGSGNGGNGSGNGAANGSDAGGGGEAANGSDATGGNGGNAASVTNLPSTGTGHQASSPASHDANLLFLILLLAMTTAVGAWLYAGRRAKKHGGR